MVELAIPEIDPKPDGSAIKKLITRIALSRPGTWFYSQVAARVDPWLMRVSRGASTSASGWCRWCCPCFGSHPSSRSF